MSGSNWSKPERPAITKIKLPAMRQPKSMNRMYDLGEAVKAPKRDRGGINRRGPREKVIGHREAPPEPVDWEGSDGEWAVYWALTALSYTEGLDFYYISRIGRAHKGQVGYTEADFLIPMSLTAIMVHGEYFHYQQGHAKQAHDEIVLATIRKSGYNPVVIDVSDALSDPIYYTREALNGIEHSSRPH